MASVSNRHRAFGGPMLIARDPRDYGEVRWIGIGRIAPGAILTVVFTARRGKRRLISARAASRKERSSYEKALQ
ncbi:MAG: BrnT family toxin [Enhydrobacter sp.]|nr:MAG: BrnT family toxin [Enhydrobacter sp.]